MLWVTMLGHEAYKGMLTKLSRKAAEAILDLPVSNLTNVKMHLMQDGREIPGSLYAKVIDAVAATLAVGSLSLSLIVAVTVLSIRVSHAMPIPA